MCVHTSLSPSLFFQQTEQFDDIYKCDDIYVAGDASGDEDAYMCLP